MKTRKLALLLAVAAVGAFASAASAQQVGDTLYPYVYIETGVYPLPPTVSTWQESTNDLLVCQRTRTVVDGGCYFNDINDPYNYQDVCQYPDYGIADSQVGVYVPGTGCTNWKSTSYTWVSGGTGSPYPTGSLVDE